MISFDPSALRSQRPLPRLPDDPIAERIEREMRKQGMREVVRALKDGGVVPHTLDA